MQLRALVSEEDAVSPVIGVILMVAITVILAAVIGAFVLGLGGNQSVTPQVQFDVDEEDGGDVVFTHASGDTITGAPDKLSLAGPVDDIGSGSSIDTGGAGDNDLQVGDTVTASLDGTEENGDEVRIVFSAEGESDTSALITYTLSNQT